jgi:putative ABC transport system substrate-binding protein
MKKNEMPAMALRQGRQPFPALKRREFLGFLGTATLASFIAPAHAQPPAKVRRIGVLSQGMARAHPTPMMTAFLNGLRELGWIQGQNLAIEWRFSEGTAEALPHLAAELAGLPLDLIVASPTRPVLAARDATRTMPIVFIHVADPIAAGILTNLARPGGNITGLSTMATESSGKRLELFREVLPTAKRAAVLWNRPSQAATQVFREMTHLSPQVDLELEDVGVSSAGEFKDAFAAASRARVGGVMVIDDPVIASYRHEVMEIAAEASLPVFSQYADFVDGGGLLAYGPSLTEIYRRGAIYVDRILRGAKPSDLPVEQPAIFDLVINLRTASALGLEVPPTVLARATRVVE